MPDSYSPTLVTVDEAGRVGADFTGHVKAAGLDLDAGTSSSPPADRKVRWLRASDGTLVADVYGYEAGPNRGGFFARALGRDGSIAALHAEAGAGGAGVSTLRAIAERVGPPYSLDLAELLDSSGRSDFVRLAADQAPGRLRLRTGSTTADVPVTPADGADVAIPLPSAWATSHLLFIAFPWPRSTWAGFHVDAPGLADTLGSGVFHVTNTSLAQTLDVQYLSLGV